MSKSDEPIGLIGDALNQSSQTSGSQVAIAAAAFVGLAIFTLGAFSLLRPNNKIVYQPKLKYAAGEKKPPPISDGVFGWIPPILKLGEADLLPLIGLDAVTYLRFCKMIVYITAILAIIMCGTLIPVDLTFHLKNGNDASTKQYNINALTMNSVSGNYIWAHVAMSYIGTIVALFFIWLNYRQMVRLRWKWFRSDDYQTSFNARTLMITHVDKRMRSDEALAGALSSIGMPYPTTDVHISRVVGQLPYLIEEHDETVRKLERVLAKWLKDPNHVPSKRPTMKIGAKMGFGGKQVDAVDYLTNRINNLEATIENWKERISERKPESYGFASMATVPFAHAAARSLRGKKPRGLEVTLAPPPRDIIWKNLNLSKSQRFRSSVWGFVILSILLFINAVPLVAVALISQMERFKGVLPFLATWQNSSSWSFSAVSGLAPPAISGVFGYFLPPLMRRIGKYRGVTTRNRLDRVITNQYFGFLIISQFIVFTLVGVTLTTIAAAIKNSKDARNVDHILATVKNQYLNMGNYWLTWIPLRLFVAAFDISQAIKLLYTWVLSAFLGRTPRDIREFTKPPSFDYAIYYANMLFLFAVGMLYATLAPLVLAFVAVCAFVSFYLYKYMHIYVVVTKNESGGRLWRVVINRLLVCIVFMQVILALAVALDQHWPAFACLPPILFVLAFKIYCRIAFDRQFDWYIPDASEIASLKTHTGDASHHRLARRFGHPSLHQKLFTPLVHAKVKHLLPQVYSGRLDEHDSYGDPSKTSVMAGPGGLEIKAVEEEECAYDPKLDNDAASIFSTSTAAPFRGAPSRQGTADFQTQYAGYMAGGPRNPGNAFEMNNLAAGSQENLLEKAAMYDDTGRQQHFRKGSAGTMLSFNSRPSPGNEIPPPQPAGAMYRPNTAGSQGSGNGNGSFFPPGAGGPIRPGQPVRQDSYGNVGRGTPPPPRGAGGYLDSGRSSPGPGQFYASPQRGPSPAGAQTPGSRGMYGAPSGYASPSNMSSASLVEVHPQHSMAVSAASMYAEAPQLPPSQFGGPPQPTSAARFYNSSPQQQHPQQAPYYPAGQQQPPRGGPPYYR
ncbi:DUF221-domain-containing protein [Jaminaea rosea]|uniref:DUF221-domain-containing protein n=1 Tax=Jaminaea rosea TaxID=1569628 RepID=A0A316UNJ8_9BASI|nr:DUF221-domain-containing protein [Jaminaea rosea]PWN26882.1 DUF221-domain-containing protein [Jaminaea rosea]